jgi:hypothetical protein
MSENSQHVRFAESLDKQQMKYHPDQIIPADIDRVKDLIDIPPRTTGAMAEQFPTAALTAYDKRDKVMSAKLALQDPTDPGITPFGKLEAKDEDFQWAIKKAAAAEEANFERWFAQNFDFMSPAQKQVAKRLFPKFYQDRMRLLDEQCKRLQDLARLNLMGVETMKDVETLYLAETGRLDLGPLNNILHPEEVGEFQYGRQRFQRGLWNPFQVYGKIAYDDSTKSRIGDAFKFAKAEYPAENFTMGRTTGVAAIGAPSAQGTKQWWEVLMG